LAQWSRNCPKPSDQVFESFLEEAKRIAVITPPEQFTRRTIARICRNIGRPTMQEKWLMLFDRLALLPGFEKVPRFPIPTDYLLAKIQDCFRIVLPVWFTCKDIDISDDIHEYLRNNPEHANDCQITNFLKLSEKKLPSQQHHLQQPKRRKSFPHNFMIREFLKQVQSNFSHDSKLANCFDIHQICHKQISRSIEFFQSMIWKHICETINTGGEIDLSLSLPFSSSSASGFNSSATRNDK
jgi:hypothetical protein